MHPSSTTQRCLLCWHFSVSAHALHVIGLCTDSLILIRFLRCLGARTVLRRIHTQGKLVLTAAARRNDGGPTKTGKAGQVDHCWGSRCSGRSACSRVFVNQSACVALCSVCRLRVQHRLKTCLRSHASIPMKSLRGPWATCRQGSRPRRAMAPCLRRRRHPCFLLRIRFRHPVPAHARVHIRWPQSTHHILSLTYAMRFFLGLGWASLASTLLWMACIGPQPAAGLTEGRAISYVSPKSCSFVLLIMYHEQHVLRNQRKCER